jgi:hypothetical protein
MMLLSGEETGFVYPCSARGAVVLCDRNLRDRAHDLLELITEAQYRL